MKTQTGLSYEEFIPLDTDFYEPPESVDEVKAFKRLKAFLYVLELVIYAAVSTFFWICGYATCVIVITLVSIAVGICCLIVGLARGLDRT